MGETGTRPLLCRFTLQGHDKVRDRIVATLAQTRPSIQRIAPRPVVIIALVTAVCLLGDSALYAILPSKLDAFAVSPTAVGLILGVNRYIRLVSNTAAGWAFERMGFHGPFLFAIALAAVTTFSYGFFTGFWPLFLAHGAWGISWSLLRLGGYLAVIGTGSSANIGRLMGVLYGGARGGSLVAVLLGGVLADSIGGRETFLVLGGLTLFAFTLVPFSQVPHTLGRRKDLAADSVESLRVESATMAGPSPLIMMVNIQIFVFGLVVSGLMVATAGYLLRTIASDGTTVMGLTIGVGLLSGLLLGVRWTGDLGLSVIFGHASDRIGRNKIILVSIAIVTTALALIAVERSLVVVFPAVSVLFIAGTALVVALNASIGGLAPVERRASVLSRYATWQDVGSGTGPFVGLLLATNVGFGWTYAGGAAIMAAAGLLYAWAVSRERPLRQRP